MNNSQVESPLIDQLNNKKAAKDGFQVYLNYIRLPRFKNLAENTRIDFDFPVTFLVGKNGSGKSSILHALYGTSDQSPSKFWFETAIDSIEARNCFIYGYYNREAQRDVEILKTRIMSKKGKTAATEYWEPSRPLKEYEMEDMPPISENESLKGRSKTRWNGMIRKIVYMDFRSELSAFDKCFYFYESFKQGSSNTVQNYIRKKSTSLQKALSKGHIAKVGKVAQNYKFRDLTKEEINNISYILGKEYRSAKIIDHKFYKIWGTSIVFETSYDHIYSDAFSGSGETAIVKLILAVINAEKGSLVLLDEPEVSLYPGAQSRLRDFLLNLSIKKDLQIIISTHSPVFIEGMPDTAIKVFYQDKSSGRVHKLFTGNKID